MRYNIINNENIITEDDEIFIEDNNIKIYNNSIISKNNYTIIKNNLEDKSYLKLIKLDESSLNKYNIHSYFYDIYNNILNGNLIENGPLVQLTKNNKIKLKMHQKRMIYEMLKREDIKYRLTSRINAFILSDKVGSGKSIDIL